MPDPITRQIPEPMAALPEDGPRHRRRREKPRPRKPLQSSQDSPALPDLILGPHTTDAQILHNLIVIAPVSRSKQRVLDRLAAKHESRVFDLLDGGTCG